MAIDSLRYFTLVIPWVPLAHQTEWHPTDAAGPFATLTRGAFATVAEAIAWGSARLGGAPYSVALVTPDAAGPLAPLKGHEIAAAFNAPALATPAAHVAEIQATRRALGLDAPAVTPNPSEEK